MQEEVESVAAGVNACCQEAMELLVVEGVAKLKDGQAVVELGPSLTAFRYCPFCGEDAGDISRALASLN